MPSYCGSSMADSVPSCISSRTPAYVDCTVTQMKKGGRARYTMTVSWVERMPEEKTKQEMNNVVKEEKKTSLEMNNETKKELGERKKV